MSIALDRFCCIVEFIMPSVVELSICTGVGGYAYPISSSIMRKVTAALQSMKVAPHSSSDAADMTSFNDFTGGVNGAFVFAGVIVVV